MKPDIENVLRHTHRGVQHVEFKYINTFYHYYIGGEQLGVNPKINNMLPGYRNAHFNLIWICDSGIIGINVTVV